jgi:hypothetical protein
MRVKTAFLRTVADRAPALGQLTQDYARYGAAQKTRVESLYV